MAVPKEATRLKCPLHAFEARRVAVNAVRHLQTYVYSGRAAQHRAVPTFHLIDDFMHSCCGGAADVKRIPVCTAALAAAHCDSPVTASVLFSPGSEAASGDDLCCRMAAATNSETDMLPDLEGSVFA